MFGQTEYCCCSISKLIPANRDKNTPRTIWSVTYEKSIPLNQDKTCRTLKKKWFTNNCIFETKGFTSMIKDNFLAWVCIVYYITLVNSLYIAGHGIWYTTIQHTTAYNTILSLENLTSPNYHVLIVAKMRLFWWYHLKIWTDAIITMFSVHENKIILIHSLKNLSYPCNCELKYLHKYPRFNEIIWKFNLRLLSRAKTFAQKDSFDDITGKFELALLSRPEIFAKKPIWLYHLKI